MTSAANYRVPLSARQRSRTIASWPASCMGEELLTLARMPTTADEAAYLYHYCSGSAAQAILAEDPPCFLVGTGDYGTGVYATDIPPEDAETLDRVSSHCFGGAAQPPEIDHVFVLHRGNAEYEFRQQPSHQWLARTNDLTIDLDTLVVELRRLNSEEWAVVARWNGWEWEEAAPDPDA